MKNHKSYENNIIQRGNNENHKKHKTLTKISKIIEFQVIIMKTLEFHLRNIKIMKILEF